MLRDRSVERKYVDDSKAKKKKSYNFDINNAFK